MEKCTLYYVYGGELEILKEALRDRGYEISGKGRGRSGFEFGQIIGPGDGKQLGNYYGDSYCRFRIEMRIEDSSLESDIDEIFDEMGPSLRKPIMPKRTPNSIQTLR